MSNNKVMGALFFDIAKALVFKVGVGNLQPQNTSFEIIECGSDISASGGHLQG